MADDAPRQPPVGLEGQVPPSDADLEAQGQMQAGEVWEGGRQPGLGGDRQLGQVVAPVGQQVVQMPYEGYQLPPQGTHPGPLAYRAPAVVHPYQVQGVPMAVQPANVPYIVQPTPALQATVLEKKKEGGFGGATIRIQDQSLAAAAITGMATVGGSYVASQATQSAAGIAGTGIAAGAMSLAAFYLANRLKTDRAICRAVEKDGHIQVEAIEEGSLLARVKFRSQAGYWVLRSLNEKIHQGTDRTCLQLLLEDELQRIGWNGPIQVGLEGWWFADEEGQEEEQEEAAGTEQEEERWEWAGMLEKQPAPPSMTTEGDSGLPEDVSSVAAMSITSAEEVEKGPFKIVRSMLQKHKDSPTAQRHITAYRSWEEGAEILTSSGYTDLGGLKALVRGFMQRDVVSPSGTSTVLYGQSWLNFNKDKLNQEITSQLQADPTDSTCLLLTALQLPHGDSRMQALQHVVAAILQHGPGDWLYQHLHHIYCYLGCAIWEGRPRSPQTMETHDTTDLSALAEALSAMASSLMYKQNHQNPIYVTAVLSKQVSDAEAIRQFEHLLRLAPECDFNVPDAHYHLATLYGQQQDRQKVIHHFNRGQHTDDKRLPGFPEVPRSIKGPARKAFESAMAQGN